MFFIHTFIFQLHTSVSDPSCPATELIVKSINTMKNASINTNTPLVRWLFPTKWLVILPDAISESSPRVVDDNRARKLSNELRRCSYYETCATYGLNVERVFQDGKCNYSFIRTLNIYGRWCQLTLYFFLRQRFWNVTTVFNLHKVVLLIILLWVNNVKMFTF